MKKYFCLSVLLAIFLTSCTQSVRTQDFALQIQKSDIGINADNQIAPDLPDVIMIKITVTNDSTGATYNPKPFTVDLRTLSTTTITSPKITVPINQKYSVVVYIYDEAGEEILKYIKGSVEVGAKTELTLHPQTPTESEKIKFQFSGEGDSPLNFSVKGFGDDESSVSTSLAQESMIRITPMASNAEAGFPTELAFIQDYVQFSEDYKIALTVTTPSGSTKDVNLNISDDGIYFDYNFDKWGTYTFKISAESLESGYISTGTAVVNIGSLQVSYTRQDDGLMTLNMPNGDIVENVSDYAFTSDGNFYALVTIPTANTYKIISSKSSDFNFDIMELPDSINGFDQICCDLKTNRVFVAGTNSESDGSKSIRYHEILNIDDMENCTLDLDPEYFIAPGEKFSAAYMAAVSNNISYTIVTSTDTKDNNDFTYRLVVATNRAADNQDYEFKKSKAWFGSGYNTLVSINDFTVYEGKIYIAYSYSHERISSSTDGSMTYGGLVVENLDSKGNIIKDFEDTRPSNSVEPAVIPSYLPYKVTYNANDYDLYFLSSDAPTLSTEMPEVLSKLQENPNTPVYSKLKQTGFSYYLTEIDTNSNFIEPRRLIGIGGTNLIYSDCGVKNSYRENTENVIIEWSKVERDTWFDINKQKVINVTNTTEIKTTDDSKYRENIYTPAEPGSQASVNPGKKNPYIYYDGNFYDATTVFDDDESHRKVSNMRKYYPQKQ